ncbi:hypothetical protein [Paenibacillus alkalitolerans]|uniref:hypothetical protein n=1 Tax=Paenibacillus alkalitolerans TaxID=2799335 RepID=UPI0018F548F8|nr:hypothetical protein [Paenibacillus alkalitolerans]
MSGIAFIIAAAVIIAIIEVPAMLKKKLKRDLTVFFILLLFGTTTAILQSLHVTLPNPLDWITFVYKPASDAIQYLLK